MSAPCCSPRSPYRPATSASRPITAVSSMATAPPARTRAAARRCEAPPSIAPTIPRAASNTRVDAAIAAIRTPADVTLATRSGTPPPMAKLRASAPAPRLAGHDRSPEVLSTEIAGLTRNGIVHAPCGVSCPEPISPAANAVALRPPGTGTLLSRVSPCVVAGLRRNPTPNARALGPAVVPGPRAGAPVPLGCGLRVVGDELPVLFRIQVDLT
jgi:hypothetical protein